MTRYLMGNKPIHYVAPFEFKTACGIKNYYTSKREASHDVNLVECSRCKRRIKQMQEEFKKKLIKLRGVEDAKNC